MDTTPNSAPRSSAAARTPLTDGLMRSSGGYELVLAAVLLGLFGFFLDRRLGWTPVLTVVFTICGFTGAVLSVYARYKAEIHRLGEETAALRSRARVQPAEDPA